MIRVRTFPILNMLKLRTTETAQIFVDMYLTSPIVYLDNCVITRLANNDIAKGNRFRELLLEKQGTLYLSWINLLEFFGLGAGPTYRSISEYLNTFKTNFAIMDNDAKQVIEREKSFRRDNQNPAVDTALVKELINRWDGLSEISLGILLDDLNDPSVGAKWKSLHANHKKTLQSIFSGARDRYRKNPANKKVLDEKKYTHIPGTPPTKYIYDILLRECTITNDEFNESDGPDFEHAVVGSAYSDIIVLDKKWTRRLRKLDLPRKSAKVFDVTEIDKCLEYINGL